MIYFLLHRREAAHFWRTISTRAVNDVRWHCVRQSLDQLPRMAFDRMNKGAIPRGLLVVPSERAESGWVVVPL